MRATTARRAAPLALLLLPGAVLAAKADNNVEWDGIAGDTTAQFVNPVTPVAGQAFTVRARAYANDLTSAKARVWLAIPGASGGGQEQYLTLSKSASGPGNTFDLWSGTLTVPTGTTQIYWRFELTDGSKTAYYDAGAAADNTLYRGVSDTNRGDFNSFTAVVGFKTPTWAQSAVWYQVFPDRFYNGSATNDRLNPDDQLWYLNWAPEGVTPGTCDGNVAGNCELHAAWAANPTGPCDFFGGDLNGVTAKLGYIEDLGATSIYLNPVFRSRSNHKYDTMDYTSVDPRFGGDSALEELVQGAHDRNMEVILDGVFNHASDVSQYYNAWPDLTQDLYYPASTGAWEELFKQQGPSTWSTWFKTWSGQDTYDVDRDCNKTEGALRTCGWYGFEFMPNLDYKSDTNSAPRKWLYGGTSASSQNTAAASIAGMWVENRAQGGKMMEGADGWRLDVPDNAGYATNTTAGNCDWRSNDESLWTGFRTAVKTVNPDAYITGEIWRNANPSDGSPNWLANNTFDGVMNYYFFGMPMTCYLNGSGVHEAQGDSTSAECVDAYAGLKKGNAADLDNLDDHLALMRRVYPAGAYMASQNLLSSHDTARFISRKGANLDTLKNAFYFQATLPGAPMVYYGDEIGLTGGNDPLNRKTYPWGTEGTDPAKTTRELLRKLLCIRNNFPALSTGSWLTIAANSAEDTLGFARWTDNSTVVVAINSGDASRSVRLPVNRLGIADGTVLVDLVSGTSATVSAGSVTVSVAAHAGVILVDTSAASAADVCSFSNQAPTADAGDDFSVPDSEAIVLDGSASVDPDGDNLTYVWTNEAGGVLGSGATITLPPSAAGTYTYLLTVSDGELDDTDDVTVTVTATCSGCNCRLEEVDDDLPLRGLSFLVLGLPLAVFLRRRRA